MLIVKYITFFVLFMGSSIYQDNAKNDIIVAPITVPKDNWTCPECGSENPYWNTACSECGEINW